MFDSVASHFGATRVMVHTEQGSSDVSHVSKAADSPRGECVCAQPSIGMELQPSEPTPTRYHAALLCV